MAGNDISDLPFRPQVQDLRVAIALLTRLPLPHPDFNALGDRPAAHAAWAYPLVGLIIGGLGIAVIWGALALGLPPAAAALIALLITVFCTGAMHEDGLADCADGFWGGWTVERRLEIMKDSQIGTYGVIALIFALCMRWVLITALAHEESYVMALLCAAVMSRAAMVCIMYSLPHARQSGLSRQTGRPPLAVAGGAMGFWGIALLFCAPSPVWISVLLTVASLAGVIWIAQAKIKGQTGDVLGATQQVTELLFLASFVAVLAN